MNPKNITALHPDLLRRKAIFSTKSFQIVVQYLKAAEQTWWENFHQHRVRSAKVQESADVLKRRAFPDSGLFLPGSTYNFVCRWK